MLVTEPDRVEELSDQVEDLWRTLGTHVLRGQSRLDSRLDRFDGRLGRVESDVAVLKQDVAVLKVDVATLKEDVATLKVDMVETRDRLGRLERATQAGFNRMDAQFERLIGLIQRDEVASA